MVTVAHIVRKIIQDKPFIQECMNMDLINHGALAQNLKPEIEAEMGKEVKHLTISMALRRLNESNQETSLSKLVVDQRTDLSSRSHLVEYVVRKTDRILDGLNEFHREIRVEEGDLLSIIQGTTNLTVISNEKHTDKLDKILPEEVRVIKRTGLAAIFMTLPTETCEVPGFYYLITRGLAFNNIPILNLSNIYSQFLFLFHNEDLTKAYNVLYDLISRG